MLSQNLKLIFVLWGLFALGGTLLMVPLVSGRLREEHFVMWERLGRPSLVNKKFGTSARLLWFVVSGEFRALNDPKLTHLAKLAWLPFFSNLLLSTAFLLMFLVGVASLLVAMDWGALF